MSNQELVSSLKKNLKFVFLENILLPCSLILVASIFLSVKSGQQTSWPDEKIYINVADGLVKNGAFTNENGQLSAFRPPGYPFLLALIFRCSGGVIAAKIFGGFMLALTAYIICEIVRLVVNQKTSFPAWLICFYPVLIYTSATLTPQILGALLFVAGLWISVAYPFDIRFAVLSGILFGMLILTIPSFILNVLMVFVYQIFAASFRNRFSRACIVVTAIMMLLTVLPWVYRCSALFNAFVFVSTNSGENLLYGNSPNATFDSGSVNISAFSPGTDLDEYQLDVHYRKSAWNWVLNNPTESARLYFLKVVNYFNYKNKLSAQNSSSVLQNVVMFITYYPLLLVTIFRCFLWRVLRFNHIEFLMYLIYFGNAFLAAIVYTRIRYRLPFDCVLIGMVSILVYNMLAGQIHKSPISKT